MPEKIHTVDDVFGVSREVPLNYVSRDHVDRKFIDSLSRNVHVVIYGSSKQGKTSLRKHCLSDDDYNVISCQNRWNTAELHSAILRNIGYSVKQSTAKNVSGLHKINVTFEGKAGIPLFTEAKGGGAYEFSNTATTTENYKNLELDPSDVNDIVRALEEIKYNKFIVLEDFHYLPDETQRDFSFSLKAFHEKSKITFIIVGVWREENRLITYNGDLTDRVISVDVDTWSESNLSDVISAGEALLNVVFDKQFREDLIRRSFDSVHIVQESCRRALRAEGIFNTQQQNRIVASKISASEMIQEVVNDQGGRFNGFLMNFSDGFQQTDLEMPKWIIFVILTSTIEQLTEGLRLREISRRIKEKHPSGDDLNNGNITQALNSASSLQVRKNIRPIIIDYDSANRNLHVVDKGFLIWLDNQDRNELLADLGMSVE